ncbi:MAG: hypothetical protein AB203_00440 [Parcubacteria bacterium C7867-008]|nr:MAG: hypothetical protein AB203_00440 [Parcubacteria bacterium C7867-008]
MIWYYHHHPEVLSLVKDLATISAAIIASYVALAGLGAWKRQLHGKEDYQLARRYLREVYRLRNGLKSVRNPYISVGEMHAALKESGEENPDPIADRKKTDFAVYSRRWEEVKQASVALDVELLEAEVLWGKEAVSKQKPLRQKSNELFSALQQHLNERPRVNIDDLLYDAGDKDKFTLQVEEAIKPIEEYLAPHLKIEGRISTS